MTTRPLTLAQQKLVEEHVKWATSTAIVRYRHRWWDDMDELESTALFALVIAAQRYDGRPDVQFRTYASVTIRSHVLDARRRIMHDRGYVRDVRVNRDPEHRQRRKLLMTSVPNDVLDSMTTNGGSVDNALLLRHVKDGIRNARDCRIIRLLLQDYAQREIGEILGVNESRVSQLIAGIVTRVQEHLGVRRDQRRVVKERAA